jgi:hypothetical protein
MVPERDSFQENFVQTGTENVATVSVVLDVAFAAQIRFGESTTNCAHKSSRGKIIRDVDLGSSQCWLKDWININFDCFPELVHIDHLRSQI